MGNFAENLNLGNRVRPPWKKKTAPLQPQEIVYFCKVRLKKGLKLCIFSPPNTKLATPTNRIYTYKFGQKRDWKYSAFIVQKNTHSFKKRMIAFLQSPEMVYFCEFRPKRAWNYAKYETSPLDPCGRLAQALGLLAVQGGGGGHDCLNLNFRQNVP